MFIKIIDEWDKIMFISLSNCDVPITVYNEVYVVRFYL